jgi:hypothetical protein
VLRSLLEDLHEQEMKGIPVTTDDAVHQVFGADATNE